MTIMFPFHNSPEGGMRMTETSEDNQPEVGIFFVI